VLAFAHRTVDTTVGYVTVLIAGFSDPLGEGPYTTGYRARQTPTLLPPSCPLFSGATRRLKNLLQVRSLMLWTTRGLRPIFGWAIMRAKSRLVARHSCFFIARDAREILHVNLAGRGGEPCTSVSTRSTTFTIP